MSQVEDILWRGVEPRVMRLKVKSWDALAIAFLLLLPFVVFWQVTLGQRALDGDDISSFFLPVRFELARALSQGRLPFWAPNLQSGFPLFAEGQVAALYPLSLLLHRLLPVSFALSYSILFHIAWAALGMYLLARSMGSRVASAVLAALTLAFGGFFFAHLPHVALLATASWLPWLALSQVKYWKTKVARTRAWWFFIGSVFVGLQFLAGSPNVAMLNLIAFFLFGMASPFMWGNRSGGRSWRNALVMTVFSILLGTGIAAIQLLPTAELIGYSLRGGTLEEGFSTSYSLPPLALTQFVAPFWALGEPSSPNREFWGYFGILPVILVVLALFRRRDTQSWLLFFFGLGALSLALGKFNPIYELLSNLPVFNLFRAPARFILLFVFASALVAAAGLDELLSRLSAGWRPVVSIAVTGIMMVDLILFLRPFLSTIDPLASPGDQFSPPQSVTAMDATDPLGRIFTNIYNETLRPNHPILYDKQMAQVYSPLALQRNEDYANHLSPAMLDLLGVRYFILPSGPLPEEFQEPAASVVFDLFRNRVDFQPVRTVQVEITSYTDKTVTFPDGLLAGELELSLASGDPVLLPIRIGKETADWALNGYSQGNHSPPSNPSLFPGYLASTRRSFQGAKYVARYHLPAPLDVTGLRAESRLAEGTLTIERVILADDAGRTIPVAALAQRNDMAVVFKSHAVTVLENQDVLPRAFVVHQSEIVPDSMMIARMRDSTFRSDRTVLLSEGQPLMETGDNVTDHVEIKDYGAEHVSLDVSTQQPGLLVLADTFYPGWQVSVDATSAPLYRADYIFRAVPLSPGQHNVHFEYRPALFYWGALITGCSLILTILVTALIRRRTDDATWI